MQLSQDTINAFKVLAQINNSIIVKPGNVLKTLSDAKTVFARAEVPDEFVKPFAIYNLAQFLGTLSLFNNPELTFSDDFVTIKSDRSSSKYWFADSSMITTPSKDLTLPSVDCQFELSGDVIKKCFQAAGVLQCTTISIVGDGTKIRIVVRNSSSKASNTFEFEVGETADEFEYNIDFENIRPILNNGDFDVELAAAGIGKFSNSKFTFFVAVKAS